MLHAQVKTAGSSRSYDLRRLRREVATISSSVARSARRESFFKPSSSSRKGFEGATASSCGNW